MSLPTDLPMPPRLVELKKELVPQDAESQARLIESWNDLLAHLAQAAKEYKEHGTEIIPTVEFADLDKLDPAVVGSLKRHGSVVIKNVVPDEEARKWKQDLVDYIKANPTCDGFPEDDKQFFELYWTKSQVRARSHPNVLTTMAWLNKLYKAKSGVVMEGVDLDTPLIYADRFRIRHPGGVWDQHPPHVDGGSIERWEDPVFRGCYKEILSGNWKAHDPYDLEYRLNAKTSMYGRHNQSSVFRTFQGWLALSETAPTEGTLKVYPDIILSNAYMMLRPFFRQKSTLVTENPIDPENWEFDISTPDFPGIFAQEKGFRGPRPNDNTHPHLQLENTMTSMPKVYPGDMVFWHCDVIHSVEAEHTGQEDSAVMYIPAVPVTPENERYVALQAESFLKAVPPPDFPPGPGEATFVGTATPEDIVAPVGKRAMGLPVTVA